MMKTRISALMDGELDEHETDDILRSMRQEAGLRVQWNEFHVIGEAMRHESDLDVDLTARVMAALDAEPTVLLPSARPRLRRLRPLMALAASAAGVALVAWVGLGTPPNGVGEAQRGAPMPQLASAPVAMERMVPAPVVSSAAGESSKLQDYLLAHHAHASTAAVANGTHYVRIVSMDREGR